MTCRACLSILSLQSARYKAHLLSCENFKVKDAEAYRRLLHSHASPAESAPEGSGGGPSRSHSVAATNAFYMSMSTEHTETVNFAYAEAVFLSGGTFGNFADDEEWDVFWVTLIGVVRRPPSRQTMSTKCVNTVFSKVDARVRGILCTTPGVWFQCDAWTDPSGSRFSRLSLAARSHVTCRTSAWPGAARRLTRWWPRSRIRWRCSPFRQATRGGTSTTPSAVLPFRFFWLLLGDFEATPTRRG